MSENKIPSESPSEIPSESYFFCVDFESVGGIPSENGFTCVGATIVDNNNNILFEYEGHSRMDNYKESELCLNEFWNKHPEKLEKMREKCRNSDKNPYEVIEELLEKANETISKKNIPRNKITPITDCTGYDPMLLGFFSKNDIMRLFGKYSPWLDVSSFYKGIGRKRITNDYMINGSSKKLAIQGIKQENPNFEFLSPTVQHDHTPLNDAINIVMTFNQINNALKTL